MNWCFESWRNLIRTFCRFEFWIFYTRFLLNIEIFWNNNIIWFESLLKLYAVRCIYKTWKIIVIVIFASISLTWKIIVIVIFASNILFDFNQFALKIWKSFSWMIQKKTWFDDFAVCCFQYRMFDFVQFTIFDLMIDNWLNDKEIEFEFFFIFLFFCFIHSNRWVVREKWLNAKNVIRFFIDEIDAIALNISNFENFLDFLHSFHLLFTFTILNARLNQTAISENNFDTIQLFMRRKF